MKTITIGISCLLSLTLLGEANASTWGPYSAQANTNGSKTCSWDTGYDVRKGKISLPRKCTQSVSEWFGQVCVKWADDIKIKNTGPNTTDYEGLYSDPDALYGFSQRYANDLKINRTKTLDTISVGGNNSITNYGYCRAGVI